MQMSRLQAKPPGFMHKFQVFWHSLFNIKGAEAREEIDDGIEMDLETEAEGSIPPHMLETLNPPFSASRAPEETNTMCASRSRMEEGSYAKDLSDIGSSRSLECFCVISMTGEMLEAKMEERIGAGSFGSVYVGSLISADGKTVKVAIKDNYSFTLSKKALDEERQVYEQLPEHSNIVKYLGCNKQDKGDMGPSCIILECLPQNLHHALLEDPDFKTYEHVLRVLLGVAEGLQHLHSNQIVHFDLTPSNILLTVDKEAKITDFGASKVRLERSLSASRCGTRGFIAPELLLGGWFNTNNNDSNMGVKVTDTVDIYSFGVVTYVCVSGSKRETAEIEDQMLRDGRYVTFGGSDATQVPCECPKELRGLINECLRFDMGSVETKEFGRPKASELVVRIRQMLNLSWAGELLPWKANGVEGAEFRMI